MWRKIQRDRRDTVRKMVMKGTFSIGLSCAFVSVVSCYSTSPGLWVVVLHWPNESITCGFERVRVVFLIGFFSNAWMESVLYAFYYSNHTVGKLRYRVQYGFHRWIAKQVSLLPQQVLCFCIALIMLIKIVSSERHKWTLTTSIYQFRSPKTVTHITCIVSKAQCTVCC